MSKQSLSSTQPTLLPQRATARISFHYSRELCPRLCQDAVKSHRSPSQCPAHQAREPLWPHSLLSPALRQTPHQSYRTSLYTPNDDRVGHKPSSRLWCLCGGIQLVNASKDKHKNAATHTPCTENTRVSLCFSKVRLEFLYIETAISLCRNSSVSIVKLQNFYTGL